MNAFFDMHVHSKFSIDGVSTMEDYCLIAEKSGIRAICFTEHVDFNSEEKNLSIVKDNRKQNFVVEDYFSELNRLREKYSSIILLSGIEFSEPNMFPDEFALYSSYPFDCITAGIHHCYNSVFPGAGNLSVSKAIHEYYQIMQKAIEFGGFQVMAHLDFPKLFFDKWIINNDVLDTILSTMINMRGYLMGGLFVRECCSKCIFNGTNRTADFVIGDHWGADKRIDDDKGTSVVILSTYHSKPLFERIKHRIECVEIDYILSISLQKYLVRQKISHEANQPMGVRVSRSLCRDPLYGGTKHRSGILEASWKICNEYSFMTGQSFDALRG